MRRSPGQKRKPHQHWGNGRKKARCDASHKIAGRKRHNLAGKGWDSSRLRGRSHGGRSVNLPGLPIPARNLADTGRGVRRPDTAAPNIDARPTEGRWGTPATPISEPCRCRPSSSDGCWHRRRKRAGCCHGAAGWRMERRASGIPAWNAQKWASHGALPRGRHAMRGVAG